MSKLSSSAQTPYKVITIYVIEYMCFRIPNEHHQLIEMYVVYKNHSRPSRHLHIDSTKQTVTNVMQLHTYFQSNTKQHLIQISNQLDWLSTFQHTILKYSKQLSLHPSKPRVLNVNQSYQYNS